MICFKVGLFCSRASICFSRASSCFHALPFPFLVFVFLPTAHDITPHMVGLDVSISQVFKMLIPCIVVLHVGNPFFLFSIVYFD